MNQACFNGRTTVVEILVEAGAKLDKANIYGNTALILACDKGNTAVVEFLLRAGANLDIVKNDGTTALILACYLGKTAVVEILLRAGASRDITSPSGLSPRRVTDREGHHEIVALFDIPIENANRAGHY